MAPEALRAAILIVSETASRDPSTDKCTSILEDVFQAQSENTANPTWRVTRKKIVPDEKSAIQNAVTSWTDTEDFANLIVTSGGTGFAISDNTPEAVSQLVHRHASGLVHGMLAASAAITPFAIMSRPVAGTRHKTLILTLPGSPKGAKENLEAVIRLLPHACLQAAGGDSRGMHIGGVKQLEKQAGVGGNGSVALAGGNSSHSKHDHQHHHHHHGHNHGSHKPPTAHTDPSLRPVSNDPLSGPSNRYRQSPYPLLNVHDALAQIAAHTPAPVVTREPLTASLIGSVLAEDVNAAEANPAFRASIVDGYAVRINQVTGRNEKGQFPVAFAAHATAGSDSAPVLQPGQIARITTGAPLPDGADAVVMVEDTVVRKTTEDGREEAEVEILTDEVKSGENVREIGSDVQKGDPVMKKGEGISMTGGEFGLLISVGTTQVKISRKPVVGVMSTGDEIVDIGERQGGQLKHGEVRDTNRWTLMQNAKAAGFQVVDLGIIKDKATALDSALRSALLRVDVLITSGGVSMGELDLLKPTIERSLDGTIHFGRVAMKPGKPTTFASVFPSSLKDPASGARGASDGKDFERKLIFSLPGNPASAVVTFNLFVLPALHQMSGVEPRGLPEVEVKLEADVKCDAQRDEYHRVVVAAKKGQDGLWASSTGGQRSSRIGSFKSANALLRTPAGGGTVAKGSKMQALLMGPVVGIRES